jgi:hypothetical protein
MEAASPNMFVSKMPVSNIMAWAKLGPVLKLITAFITGSVTTSRR